MKLANAASHEMMEIPMSLFNADGSMQSGPKSDLMKLVKKVEPTESLPALDPPYTQHIIDGTAQVYRIFTKGLTTFGEFFDRY